MQHVGGDVDVNSLGKSDTFVDGVFGALPCNDKSRATEAKDLRNDLIQVSGTLYQII